MIGVWRDTTNHFFSSTRFKTTTIFGRAEAAWNSVIESITEVLVVFRQRYHHRPPENRSCHECNEPVIYCWLVWPWRSDAYFSFASLVFKSAVHFTVYIRRMLCLRGQGLSAQSWVFFFVRSFLVKHHQMGLVSNALNTWRGEINI